ncbi:hypothetical protein JD844_017212 [Phrynosoma platyrhinos]|uniref:14 kDa phosphohistidine phosphatase n=1 Tax=Phrynosoma platyrhinos TaxID=52577 RepID=A0ABQ7SLL3_PHRPL|nr:hypothetical protein JD844_017212 [Phrynosoma platyrhinos]
MAAGAGPLSSVPEVEIDPEGTFKYILVRVEGGSGAEGHRDIVRGTAAAEFHNHIFEKGYGKADHSVTVEILKRTYKDYGFSWSDDKK